MRIKEDEQQRVSTLQREAVDTAAVTLCGVRHCCALDVHVPLKSHIEALPPAK